MRAGSPGSPGVASFRFAMRLSRSTNAPFALRARRRSDSRRAAADRADASGWQQLGPFDRAVLAAVADGVAPTSRALAAEHRVSRKALDTAAGRLADQGHLLRPLPRRAAHRPAARRM